MYNINFIVHCRKIAECVELTGAEAELDFETFKLSLTAAGRYLELHPEFINEMSADKRYSDVLTASVRTFSGWWPAPRRTWDLADDRMAFKKFCAEKALRTPKSLTAEQLGEAPVVMRRRGRSEAESQTLGPFVGSDAITALRAHEGSYLEEFITGDSLCAWYFRGELACVERRAWPSVLGDGQRSVRELADANFLAIDWAADTKRFELMCKLQKLDLDSVPASGVRVCLDFRLHSSLHAFPMSSENVLEAVGGTPLGVALRKAGPVLLEALPAPMRADTIFCATAVADRDGEVWFCDMGPGRFLHPDIYESIFGNIFGVRRVPGTQVPPPPSLQQRSSRT